MTNKKSKNTGTKKKEEEVNNKVTTPTVTTPPINKPKGNEEASSPLQQSSTPSLMTRSRSAIKQAPTTPTQPISKSNKRSSSTTTTTTATSKNNKKPSTRRNSIVDDEDEEGEQEQLEGEEQEEENIAEEMEEMEDGSENSSVNNSNINSDDDHDDQPKLRKLKTSTNKNKPVNNKTNNNISDGEEEQEGGDGEEVFSNVRVELNSDDDEYFKNSDSSMVEGEEDEEEEDNKGKSNSRSSSNSSKGSASRTRLSASQQQTTTSSSSRRKSTGRKIESSDEESDEEVSPRRGSVRQINSTTAKKPARRASAPASTTASSVNGKRRRSNLVSNSAFESDSEQSDERDDSEIDNSSASSDDEEEKPQTPVSKIRTRGSTSSTPVVSSNKKQISKPSAKKKPGSQPSKSPSKAASKARGGNRAKSSSGKSRSKKRQASSDEESEDENIESEEDSEESEQVNESEESEASDVSMEDDEEDLIELEEDENEEDFKIQKVIVTKLFKKQFIHLPYLLVDYIKKDNKITDKNNTNNSNNNNINNNTTATTITPPSVSTPVTEEVVKQEKKEDSTASIETEEKKDVEMKDVPSTTEVKQEEKKVDNTTAATTEDSDKNVDTSESKDVDIEKMDVEDSKPSSTATESENKTPNTPTIPQKEEELRFLVLYQNKSYRNARWVTEKTIEKEKENNIALVKLLKTVRSQPPSPIMNEQEANPFHYFSPEFIQIEKILSKKEVKGSGKTNKKPQVYYLCKWKLLSHEKSTWERAESLTSNEDQQAIAEYNTTQEIAEKGKKYVPRPSKQPVFNNELVPKFKSDLSLKDFQVEGFLWLTFCWYQGRSSLLADEMGLGKTIQTIAFIQYLSQKVGIKGPFLIVAPLSTLGNWHKEFLKWTDMKTLVYYGSQEARNYISRYEFKHSKDNYLFEVLLTTYETVMTDHNVFVRVPWRVLVLDEGHRIKNDKSKVLYKLRSIKTEHSVILTGTPLQNDMKELWTMLNFLDPNKFDNANNFLEEYSNLKEESQVAKLHQLLTPYLLRRLKENVELSIPIKEETVIQVELSSTQKTYYRAILERNREFLARGIKHKANLPKLSNIMIQIRKVCNHPFLIPGAEETIAKQEKIGDDDIGELLVRSSSKLVLVDKLLQRLKAEGHQVLIFSQMVESLNILEDYLQYREYTYERLDGSIKSEVRQASIDRFQDKEANRFVFLLSTRAGGVGINLTTADTVILFDSDWNPQSDLQAQARCHRIGQTNNVKVYRLITRNTYEEYLFECATKKLLLDHIVLSTNKKSSAPGSGAQQSGELEITAANPFKIQETIDDPNSPSQISQMLKYGAAYLFAETTQESNEQDKIMINEDIDKILERSTTISFDSKNTKPNSLSGFSKATFASNETDMNVDMNDENFWEKVLPDYKTVKQLEEKLGNGTALQTEESRASFVQDILDLAQSKKDDIHDSVSVEFIGDLVKLIMRVEFNPKFTLEEREKLQQTKLLLEKPRTRKRVIPEVIQTHLNEKQSQKKKGNNNNLLLPESDSSSDGGSDTDFVLPDDNDSYESDDHVETLDGHGERTSSLREKKRDKKALSKSLASVGSSAINGLSPQALLAASWNKNQKDKFKQTLLKVGFHRWKKIQTELAQQGINRSAAEIQSLSESFLEIGLKQQVSLIKDFYEILLDDTSTYNYHKIGFDTENKIIFNTDQTPSNVKRYEIKKTFNTSNLFCGQTVNVKWSVIDPQQQQQTTTTTSTSTPPVKTEDKPSTPTTTDEKSVDENKAKVDETNIKKESGESENDNKPTVNDEEKEKTVLTETDKAESNKSQETEEKDKPVATTEEEQSKVEEKPSEEKSNGSIDEEMKDKQVETTKDEEKPSTEEKSTVVEEKDKSTETTKDEEIKDRSVETTKDEEKPLTEEKSTVAEEKDKSTETKESAAETEKSVETKEITDEKSGENKSSTSNSIASENQENDKPSAAITTETKEDEKSNGTEKSSEDKSSDKMNTEPKSKPVEPVYQPPKPLSMKNPCKFPAYYLVIILDDFSNSQIIRAYPLGEASQGVTEVVLPGFANNYEFRIMFSNPATNTFRFVSEPFKFGVASNSIWQTMDFPSFQTRIQTVLTRLIQLRAIKQLVTKYGKYLTNLSIPFINRGPIPTWSSENDKSLLVGVYKHGYGKYPEIFSDPELDLMANVRRAQTQQPFNSPPDPNTSAASMDNMMDHDGDGGSSNANTGGSSIGGVSNMTDKIPSAESLRRRIQKVTDSILKKEHNEKLLKQHIAQQKQIQAQKEKEQKEREMREREIREKEQKEREFRDREIMQNKGSFNNTGYQSSKTKYSNAFYEDGNNGNYNQAGHQYRKPEYSAGDISSDEDDDFKLKKMKLSHNNNNQQQGSFFNKNPQSGFFDKQQQQLPSLGKMMQKSSKHSQQQNPQQPLSPNHNLPKGGSILSPNPTSPIKPSSKNYQNFSIRLLWESRIYPISIPTFTSLDSLKRLFIAKAGIQQTVGATGEDQNHILRFYYNDQLIPNNYKLVDFGIKDNDRISVFWESKWKTIQVKGFDYESVLMNVQDDTLLEDIVKAYFINSQPPYDIKNLRIEYNNQTLSLNTDVGTNKIKNESYLYIVPSQDIIRVFVTPSWGAEKETYALHRMTTMLSKLMDSFLKKHSLLPKQIDFYIPRLSASLRGDRTPSQSSIENETEITAILLLVRVDAVFNGTTVPYFLSTTTSFESLFQRFCEKVGIDRRNTIFSYEGRRLQSDETPEGIHMKPHVTIDVSVNQQQPSPQQHSPQPIQSPSQRFNQQPSIQSPSQQLPPPSPQRQQQQQQPSNSSTQQSQQHRHQSQQKQRQSQSPSPSHHNQQPHSPSQQQQPTIIEVEVKLVGQDAGSFIKMHTLNPFPLHILMEKFCQEHNLIRSHTLFTYKGVQLNPHSTLVDINLQDGDVIECHLI